MQAIDLIHPEVGGVTKAQIRAEMGKRFKVDEERISVRGLKTKFGGGRSSGFAAIYDDLDARKKYDMKAQL